MSDRVDLIMGTFSKALGSFGAYLASSKDVIDYLINTCRSFIYSTSLPPAVIAGNLASLEVVKEEPHRRRSLISKAKFFRDRLVAMGFEVRGSSQIVPVIAGENDRAMRFAKAVQEKGYWVLPIRPPTVPQKEARLRFSITSYHTEEILCALLKDIAHVKI